MDTAHLCVAEKAIEFLLGILPFTHSPLRTVLTPQVLGALQLALVEKALWGGLFQTLLMPHGITTVLYKLSAAVCILVMRS